MKTYHDTTTGEFVSKERVKSDPAGTVEITNFDLENKIKQKLILRGFTEKQLLNNRGLINATIDEVALMLVKKIISQ